MPINNHGLRLIIVLANRRYQLVRLRGVRTRMQLVVQAQRSNVHETTRLKVNSNDLDPGLEPTRMRCQVDCAMYMSRPVYSLCQVRNTNIKAPIHDAFIPIGIRTTSDHSLAVLMSSNMLQTILHIVGLIPSVSRHRLYLITPGDNTLHVGAAPTTPTATQTSLKYIWKKLTKDTPHRTVSRCTS